LKKSITDKKPFREFIQAMSKASRNNYQVLDGKESYKQHFNYSILSLEKRALVLANIVLNDLPKNTLLLDHEVVDLKFENNIVYLFVLGIGIFSTRVTVKFRDSEVNVADIRDKLANIIQQDIKDNFTKTILEINKIFSKVAGNYFKLVRRNFELDRSKVASYAWLHTIYWIYGEQSLLDHPIISGVSDSEMQGAFAVLLDQELGSKPNFSDHYVYYGWGRSHLDQK
jgi:hypothetical protein